MEKLKKITNSLLSLKLSSIHNQLISVLFVHSFDSICQLPGTPVCEASDTKYSGDEVENLILPDYDSCAIFCLWNPDCNGLSFLSVKIRNCIVTKHNNFYR